MSNTNTALTPSAIEAAIVERRRGRRAYAWAAGFIGAVGVIAVILNGVGWFRLPMDVTGAGAWFTVVTVMIIAPLTLLVMLGAWGFLALFRRMGIRPWPSSLQGLLASFVTLAILAVGTLLLFAEYE